MAHYHQYDKNPLGDPHFLVCTNKIRCTAPQIRDVTYNCGACAWCLAHPKRTSGQAATQ